MWNVTYFSDVCLKTSARSERYRLRLWLDLDRFDLKARGNRTERFDVFRLTLPSLRAIRPNCSEQAEHSAQQHAERTDCSDYVLERPVLCDQR